MGTFLGVSVHLQRLVVNLNLDRIKLCCILLTFSYFINVTRINLCWESFIRFYRKRRVNIPTSSILTPAESLCCVLSARRFIRCLVLAQPKMTGNLSYVTEKMLTGLYLHQNKQTCTYVPTKSESDVIFC